MKEFPIRLNVINKDEFEQIHMQRTICYLRKDLFEHIICKDENDYFDLGAFTSNYFHSKNTEVALTLFTQMKSELAKLGWKCKTSFGGTGMFIYSSAEPPPSCYEEGL
jgi:hypothetical protein